jgi:DDE superfamily endonuclease
VAAPALHAWADEAQPLRLVEQPVASDDPDPQARACYGLLLPQLDEVWLRFLDGRPVSAVTTVFLDWCCQEAAIRGKTARLLRWDNASWHRSKAVRQWIREHNRQVTPSGQGVRVVGCPLPIQSPWRNPIEPQWSHTKRRIIAPARLLAAHELAERVGAAVACPYLDHLSIPAQLA